MCFREGCPTKTDDDRTVRYVSLPLSGLISSYQLHNDVLEVERAASIHLWPRKQFAGVCAPSLRLRHLSGVVGTAPPSWTLAKSGSYEATSQPTSYVVGRCMGSFGHASPAPSLSAPENATVMLRTAPLLCLAYAALPRPPRMP